MRDFTPTSLVFIGFAMCVGAQLDSWLWGLTIALGLLWAMAVVPIVYDYWQGRVLDARRRGQRP